MHKGHKGITISSVLMHLIKCIQVADFSKVLILQQFKSPTKLKNTQNIILLLLLLVTSCAGFNGNEIKTGRQPGIFPDYIDVTIPPNIAPLNFIIKEEGDKFQLTITPVIGEQQVIKVPGNGRVTLKLKSWKKLLRENEGSSLKFEVKSLSGMDTILVFETFRMTVASVPVDPYLAYRLIPPGYYSWSRIRIMQRNLETFRESTLVENTILDKNCINCHSFANNDPGRFMVHVRGSKGGTYIMEEGKIRKTDPKIGSMPGNATYPSWHPGGRYIAYSSNQVRQGFYAAPSRSIEVFDLVGSVVLYDTKDNKIISISEEDTTRYIRTFPGWSPDGKYLYYCRAKNHISGANPVMSDILGIHHDLVRKPFDEATESFGKTEVVFAASDSNKSVSFPRISPDGKFLVFTLADFGTFPIWHAEADLYSLNIATGEISKLDLNSDETDSYHSWSSKGRWLVFSSKRYDGRTTRPYFAYIDSTGKSAKPFMLPQKDPDIYNSMIESFNIPEFVKGEIMAGPRDFLKATGQEAAKSTAANLTTDAHQ